MDEQSIPPAATEIAPPGAKPKASHRVVVFLAGLIILSIAVPYLFIFGAAATVLVAILAAGAVWKTMDRVSQEAAAKYSPAAQAVINIFVSLVGVGMVLVTIAMGFFAFVIAFFTAHPIRS